MLFVHVLKAKGLRKADRFGHSDPWCLIRFAVDDDGDGEFDADDARVWPAAARTATVADTEDPVWRDEVFLMPLSHKQKYAGVRVELYDEDAPGVETFGEFLGQATQLYTVWRVPPYKTIRRSRRPTRSSSTRPRSSRRVLAAVGGGELDAELRRRVGRDARAARGHRRHQARRPRARGRGKSGKGKSGKGGALRRAQGARRRQARGEDDEIADEPEPRRPRTAPPPAAAAAPKLAEGDTRAATPAGAEALAPDDDRRGGGGGGGGGGRGRPRPRLRGPTTRRSTSARSSATRRPTRARAPTRSARSARRSRRSAGGCTCAPRCCARRRSGRRTTAASR